MIVCRNPTYASVPQLAKISLSCPNRFEHAPERNSAALTAFFTISKIIHICSENCPKGFEIISNNFMTVSTKSRVCLWYDQDL